MLISFKIEKWFEKFTLTATPWHFPSFHPKLVSPLFWQLFLWPKLLELQTRSSYTLGNGYQCKITCSFHLSTISITRRETRTIKNVFGGHSSNKWNFLVFFWHTPLLFAILHPKFLRVLRLWTVKLIKKKVSLIKPKGCFQTWLITS